ncbi:hypothetical protein AXX17_AT3G20740 [Arabidopsis thaliana]|uniref:Uncharacterized protein n=1 Tax=Arabidopsis thaliana TaxID=3702 RepID=A0A178V9E9_ARATH|nr:hypothetical protein AXX17_AT3G20740 [Arabidopsis thaliana]
MAHKVPEATNSLCGYKVVPTQPSDRIGDDFSKLYKESTERLINLEDLIKASVEQLVQEMSDHDKAYLLFDSTSGDDKANIVYEEARYKN